MHSSAVAVLFFFSFLVDEFDMSLVHPGDGAGPGVPGGEQGGLDRVRLHVRPHDRQLPLR